MVARARKSTAKSTASRCLATEPGARCRLGEAFLGAVLADFEAHGAATIAKMREEKPDQYFKVVAAILPKEIGGEGDSQNTGESGPRIVERRIVHVGD